MDVPSYFRPPLDRVIHVNAHAIHTHYLGGDGRPAVSSSDGRTYAQSRAYLYRYGIGRGPVESGPDNTGDGYDVGDPNGYYYWGDYRDQGTSPGGLYWPEGQYVSGPRSAIDFADVTTALRGWKFMAPNANQGYSIHVDGDGSVAPSLGPGYRTDGRYYASEVTFSVGVTLPGSCFYKAPEDNWNYQANYGFASDFQALALCRITDSVLPDGTFPIYALNPDPWRGGIGPSRAVADRILATWQPWDTLLLVVDGSGSFGEEYVQFVQSFLPALVAAGRANVNLLVTRISDYYDAYRTPPRDQFSDLLTGVGITNESFFRCIGLWRGIHSGTADEINAALRSAETGNGGDTPEAQFDGMYRGIRLANLLDLGGTKGIVYLTDTCSSVVFTRPWVDQGGSQYLRMTQRGDGAGIVRNPRLGKPPDRLGRQYAI